MRTGSVGSSIPVTPRFTCLVWSGFGAYTLVAALFQWLPKSIPLIPAVSILAGLAASALVWHLRYRIAAALTSIIAPFALVPLRHCVVGCLALGMMLRILSTVFPTDFVSDHATYWALAQRLATAGTYDVGMWRSYWPPGLPLLLAPFVMMFGSASWVPLLVNLLLFAGTTLVTLRLAKRLAGERVARIAIFILAIWPNLVLATQWPHKEAVVALLLPAAMLLYLRGAEEGTQKEEWRWLNLASSGICLGLAALTQPATALFGLVFAAYEATLNSHFQRKALRLGLTGVATVLTVLPWTIRNYAVHGEFIPINTAGGVVFYSANNANATGGWIANTYYFTPEMQQAGEVERERIAYREALAWIDANKLHFAKLAFVKQARLLCCDDFAAFTLFEREDTIGHNPKFGMIATAISNAFWIILAILILYSGIGDDTICKLHPATGVMLLASVCYFLLIFSIYQSEGKHHMNFAPLIAIMSACAFLPNTRLSCSTMHCIGSRHCSSEPSKTSN